MAGAPLDRAWFEDVMVPLGPWSQSRRVAVAVSGGADSLCLAWLAAGWGRPLALIVDHGLRAESALEAAAAARTLSGFGVKSRVIRLFVAPGTSLAARARIARIAALADAALAEGLTDLLLGHHAGDQVETVLIRAARRSGPAGLAGMAAIVETPALRLVRPLLAVSPARLRATLRAEGVAWAEDPSNADPAWTRARIRRHLATDGQDLAVSALLELRKAGLAREDRSREVARTLAERASLFPEGYALLRPGAIPPDCLAALCVALTGEHYPPGTTSLVRLAAAPVPATLGGVRLMQAGRFGPGLLLVREPAAMQAPVAATPGAIWDGRFRLALEEDLPEGATFGALGEAARQLRHLSHLPYAVLRTLPALRAAGGGLAAPHIGHFHGWTNRRVRPTFCPSSPAAGAPFAYSPAGDAQPAQEPHVLDHAWPAIVG